MAICSSLFLGVQGGMGLIIEVNNHCIVFGNKIRQDEERDLQD
jgi:hypothetical protein